MPPPVTPAIDRPAWLDEQQWPFPIRCCATDAGPVAYTDTGQGPTLLFVHVGLWSFVWRDLIDRLSASFRCVTLDPPGTGLSPGSGAVGLRHAADAIDALVTTLDLDDLTLVVHDLGGPAALAAAAQWPERVSRLAALNSFGWKPHGVAFVGMLRIMGSTPMRLLDAGTGLLPRATSTRLGVGRHLDRAGRRAFRAGVRRTARGNLHRYLRSAYGHDYTSVDAGLAALTDRPLLTVFGQRNDPLRFQPRWQARFRNIRQVQIPRGYHFPMNDAPEQVAVALTGWHTDTR